jgi:hypothetical protein
MFKHGRTRKVKPKVFWDDDEIEFVDEYTYLGIPFLSNLNTATVCARFIKKAKCAENQLFGVFFRSKTKTLTSRTKLYDSLVKSMLTYCLPIWGIDHSDKLEIFQNNFLRRMCNIPKCSPNWFTRLETNKILIQFEVIKMYYFSLIDFSTNLMIA